MFDIDIRIFVLILKSIKFIINLLMSLSKLSISRELNSQDFELKEPSRQNIIRMTSILCVYG